MRRPFTVLFLVSVLAAAGAGATSPDVLLDLGVRAYRAGDDRSAIVDLSAAAEAFLSPEQMQEFVSTGRFESLERFETALVYLALAQSRAGRVEDSRESVLRLLSAERIAPTYANLPLQQDAAPFESLVKALVPAAELPGNIHLAALDPEAPLPAVRRTTETAAAPPTAEERAERQAAIEAFAAAEKARAERSEEARIRAEREAARIAAAERTAADRKADEERSAAIQREADRRVAEARADAERRVAAAEAEARARVAPAEAATRSSPAPVTATVAAADDSQRVTLLRQAEALASHGMTAEARDLYGRLSRESDLSRQILIESAVGLYRIGAFREAVPAFQRLGVFGRGEEDLRYYYAVALYENGAYTDARMELACALPFIELRDDVERYRTKIETAAQQAARK